MNKEKLRSTLNLRIGFKVLSLVAVFLVVAGAKMMVLMRFGNFLPTYDDWALIDWAEGRHADGDRPLTEFHNGDQNIFFLRFIALLIVGANGQLDHYLFFVTWSVTLAAYAVVVWWLLNKAVGGEDNRDCFWLVTFGIIFFFGLPFAGYRSGWTFLQIYAQVGLFMWVALGLAVFGSHLRVYIGALLAAVIASMAHSVGACAFVILVFIFLLKTIEDRGSWRRMAVLSSFAILGFFYFRNGFNTPQPGIEFLKETELDDLGFYRNRIDPFLKGAAWPLVNAAPFGLINLIPPFTLGIFYLIRPSFRTRSNMLLLGGAAVLVCQYLAIAVYRGHGGNNGMPSGRYYELLLPWLLVVGGCLWALFTRRKQHGLKLLYLSWAMIATAATLFLVAFRIGGFVFRESGENEQLWFQASTSKVIRKGTLPSGDRTEEEGVETGYIDNVSNLHSAERWIAADRFLVLSPEALGGYSLAATGPGESHEKSEIPGAISGFARSAVPGETNRYPFLEYWGSFGDRVDNGQKQSFVSRSFQCDSPSLVFHILESKTDRFSFYRYPMRALHLVNSETGDRIDLLNHLSKKWPMFLRDTQLVAVPIPAPGAYRIEAGDEFPDGWIGFSEPLAGGKLTPVTLQVLNSGRFLFMTGIGLLIFLAVIDWFFGRDFLRRSCVQEGSVSI